MAAPAPAAAPAASAPAASAGAPGAAPAADKSGHPGTVPSPMVGTVYLQPEPGTPSFVVGDDVGYNDLGALNDGKTITPTIDGLILSGILLSDCASPSAPPAPSLPEQHWRLKAPNTEAAL